MARSQTDLDWKPFTQLHGPLCEERLIPRLFGLETRLDFSRRGTALPCPYKPIFREVIQSAILNRTVLRRIPFDSEFEADG